MAERKLIDAGFTKCLLNILLFSIRKSPCVGAVQRAIEIIDEQPAVDAIEVVRCKDCKHYDYQCGTCKCFKDESFADENDFCSYGERKESK